MELVILVFICFASAVIILRGIRGKSLKDGNGGDGSLDGGTGGFFGGGSDCSSGDSGGGDCGGGD